MGKSSAMSLGDGRRVLLDGAIINLLSATSQDLPTLQAPSDSDFPTAVELVARNCEKF